MEQNTSTSNRSLIDQFWIQQKRQKTKLKESSVGRRNWLLNKLLFLIVLYGSLLWLLFHYHYCSVPNYFENMFSSVQILVSTCRVGVLRFVVSPSWPNWLYPIAMILPLPSTRKGKYPPALTCVTSYTTVHVNLLMTNNSLHYPPLQVLGHVHVG